MARIERRQCDQRGLADFRDMNFIRFDRLHGDEGKALTLPPAVRCILGNIPQLAFRACLALAKFKHMAVPH